MSAMDTWNNHGALDVQTTVTTVHHLTIDFNAGTEIQIPILNMNKMNIPPLLPATHAVTTSQLPPGRTASIARAAKKQVAAIVATPAGGETFHERLRAKIKAMEARAKPDLWAQL